MPSYLPMCAESLRLPRRIADPEAWPLTPVGSAFTGMLAAAGIRISMDGRGRWMDNVFIERLWRSLKHEDIYLKGYADGREAHAGIASWLAFYNAVRPHQALANRTPMAVWHEGMTAGLAVDMTLRFDNAAALPTCPRPQQQQQTALFARSERPRIQLTDWSPWPTDGVHFHHWRRTRLTSLSVLEMASSSRLVCWLGDRPGGPWEGRARRGVPHERRSGARGRDLWAGGTIARELITCFSFRRPGGADCRL